MAEDEPTTIEQINEYESQLAGIVELLESSPGDESLLVLKQDMEELLELSRANMTCDSTTGVTSIAEDIDKQSTAATTSGDMQLPALPLPPPPPPLEMNDRITDGTSSSNTGLLSPEGLQNEKYNQSIPIDNANTSGEASATAKSEKEKPHKAKKNSSKKQKKMKDFVIPDHLIPNEEDTDPERNKKRRAAKALKNKWRLQKKEIESNNRQKSWQSFQKKSSSSSSGSIFATKEGLNDRVGVVSKKKLTDFGSRKRHK